MFLDATNSYNKLNCKTCAIPFSNHDRGDSYHERVRGDRQIQLTPDNSNPR